MKKLISVCFILLLILCAGCGKKETMDLEPVPEIKADKAVKQENKDEVTQEVTDDTFKPFFIKYFALTEEDVLELNQNRPKVDAAYWEAHEGYKNKLKDLVKTYFADSVAKKLNSEYLAQELHLPKKLVVNGYVTFGPASVEQVDIVSTRNLGENKVYEVAVTTKNKVQTVSEANKQYTWDSEKGYYVKGTGGTTFIEEVPKSTYLDLNESEDDPNDEIQLIQRYWVELQAGKALKMLSVREASPLKINEETRQKAYNTSFVTREPYYKEVSAKEQSTIKKVFQTMMSKPRAFYQYYEKAAESSFEVFQEIWQVNMALDKEVLLVADYYQEAFAPYINPYKDNVDQISADMEKIIITPSAYGTQKQPRFIVTIPVKVILNNNEIVYYYYKYYVGIEQNKIEFIQFMSREEITEDVYLGKAVVEEKAAVPNEIPVAEGAEAPQAETPAAE